MTTKNQKINKSAYMPPSNQHKTTTPNTNHRTRSKNGKCQPQHNNNGGCNTTIGSNLDGFRIEFHGWKKKCLYMLILCLMTLIILNLALTLWILNVMEFSTEGLMGQLKIVAGGIQLSGHALFLDILRAISIRSRHGQPISIESSRNFSINTYYESTGYLENQIHLGDDRLAMLTKSFKITDTHGGLVLSIDHREVNIGPTTLKLTGEGGIRVEEAVHSTVIRADPGKELILESARRKLEIKSFQEIHMQSKAGRMDVTTLKDLKIHSIAGNINLDTPNIVLPNFKVPSSLQQQQQQHHQQTSSNYEKTPQKVYQLCACASGKLFFASPHTICSSDDTNVCR